MVEVIDQSRNSNDRYKPSKQIRFKTSMLRSDLCDYSDGYIFLKEIITISTEENRAIDGYKINLNLKNNSPFTSFILKINNTLIDNTEDLHVVMLMRNFIKYSKNYRKTTGILWKYYRDEPVNAIKDPQYFKFKTTVIGKRENNATTKKVEFVVPFKHLRKFSRALDMSLINYVGTLLLTLSEDCVITDTTTQAAGTQDKPPNIRAPVDATLAITGINHKYVPVVTLSTQYHKKNIAVSKSGI